MQVSKLDALSPRARWQVETTRANLAKALGQKHGHSSVNHIRSLALEKIMTLAAPRIREFVLQQGERLEDGSTAVLVDDYMLRMGRTVDGAGNEAPQLTISDRYDDGHSRQLFDAIFFDLEGAEECAGRGSVVDELAILKALDAVGPRLPQWSGVLADGLTTRHSAEREMVALDGGFPGAACREHLGVLRSAAVAGVMDAIAQGVPALAALQEADGYVWGGRYLAYDDGDKRSCSLPVAGATAVFHEDIDLIADHASWFATVEPAADGTPSRVAVWGFDRYRDDPVPAAANAIAHGIDALGEPHVALDLVTRILSVREGFDPSGLAGSVSLRLQRDAEIFGDLPAAFRRSCTRAETDFDDFRLRPDPDDQDCETVAPAP